ncbi:MAG TPA: FecR domain-containing protein [Steroidobacteraceae bacterium]
MTRASDIEHQAAEWLIRLDAHESPQDWAALDEWLAANPRHRAAFLRLSIAWRHADQLRKLRPFTGVVDPDLLSPATRRLRAAWDSEDRRASSRGAGIAWRPSRRAFGLAAAAAVASIAIGVVSSQRDVLSPKSIVYETGLGGKKTIPLEDGSTVELNTDSELHVRLTPERRSLRLVRGEALFRVAHQPSRPFDVVAGATTVRALGTEFSVRLHDPTYVEVVVAEGRVAMVPPRGLPTLQPGDALALKRGEAARFKLTGSEVERRHAWTKGLLVFAGETLPQAAAEFNRYNLRKLEIVDPALDKVTVGGTFRIDEVNRFVAALESGFNIRATVQEGPEGYDIIRLQAANEVPKK